MQIKLNGCTRIVFVFRCVVVKVPNFTCQWSHFLKGILGNLHENKTWKWNSGKYESGKSKFLCPVIWCSWGGWILVMKRAEACDWGEEINYDDWSYLGFGGDDKPQNYGWLEGRLVKIDYAA